MQDKVVFGGDCNLSVPFGGDCELSAPFDGEAGMVLNAIEGAEYESGIWTPTEDTIKADIVFANPHNTMPVFWVVCDGESQSAKSAIIEQHCVDYYRLLNAKIQHLYYAIIYDCRNLPATGFAYGRCSISFDTNTPLPSQSTASYARYYYDETGIYSQIYGGTYYWKADREYKWFAYWLPQEN